MSIFNFFKKNNVASSKKFDTTNDIAIESILKKLDIESAMIAHENWKIRLVTFLDGKSTEEMRPELICFDDRCDLGKWLHGDAKKYFEKNSNFIYLVNEHKNFHYHASNVVSLKLQGKDQKADQLLKNEFNKTSERVSFLLNQLKCEK
ncbi:CZB domain-containing protein [Undibacterium crateris]|uniref:CZB domain-containing protein n=1 Tax=Undibacterium crateris TaxID=2528175 RepID=UPI001389E542|nr:CZB domain-containing protein [Undibacterium crateris]NDI87602.1 hypothetical protein [Undibacterium crateris]